MLQHSWTSREKDRPEGCAPSDEPHDERRRSYGPGTDALQRCGLRGHGNEPVASAVLWPALLPCQDGLVEAADALLAGEGQG